MSTKHEASETPQVIFMPSGRRGRVKAGTSLLTASRELGVEIESICGGRLTCEKCRVRVEEGLFPKHGVTSSPAHLSPPTDKEAQLIGRDEGAAERLSCAALVHGDVVVFVPEESRAHKQIIRKSANERSIEISPAVRQVYVEVDQAVLGEHRGDWGRLQTALGDQWQLEGLEIDLFALRGLQGALRQGKWKLTVTIWSENEVIDVRPGYEEGSYGLAIDIGSTTVVGHLCDLRTGQILATESMMNPQVTFGEDLMSRVSYAMMHKDGLDKMHRAIIETLNQLVTRATRSAGIRRRQLYEAVVVGNTTMMHIFLAIDPIELGQAPFALANREAMNVKARDLGLRLNASAYVHVLPAEAGHVGADNVAGLLAEEPYHQDELVLMVDIGTNAEIVLGNRDWMFSASSPTGPAFEGAQISHGMRAAPGAIERVRIDPDSKEARFRVIGEESWSDSWLSDPDAPLEGQPKHLAAGICGSGIIEVVAEMYLAQILWPDGRFNSDCRCDSLQWHGRTAAYVLAIESQTTTGRPIVVTQNDVRNVQLAKAALYAGAKLLMSRAGVATADRIILAGAFGSYIDPRHAMTLGLVPDCPLDKVFAVGNAAGDGARIALLNHRKRREAAEVAQWVRYIETAADPEFQEEFVSALHLPHANDPFPHLEGILPEPIPVSSRTSRSRRRRQTPASAGG